MGVPIGDSNHINLSKIAKIVKIVNKGLLALKGSYGQCSQLCDFSSSMASLSRKHLIPTNAMAGLILVLANTKYVGQNNKQIFQNTVYNIPNDK